MFTVVLVIHVFLAAVLVVTVLLQHSKGADAGAAFGSSSASVFGASGGNSFLYKITVGIAIGFFCTSLLLAYLASPQSGQSESSVVANIQPVELNTDDNKPLSDIPNQQ